MQNPLFYLFKVIGTVFSHMDAESPTNLLSENLMEIKLKDDNFVTDTIVAENDVISTSKSVRL